MAKPRNANRVSAKEFVEDPARFLERLGESDAPLAITSRNRPVAYLVSAEGYEYNRKRLEGFERLVNNLESPEKARREAHARVMAELGRRSRKF